MHDRQSAAAGTVDCAALRSAALSSQRERDASQKMRKGQDYATDAWPQAADPSFRNGRDQMFGYILPRAGAIGFTVAGLVAAAALATPAAAAVKSQCDKNGLHTCTSHCHIGDSACFQGCWFFNHCSRNSGGQTKASVKSQQPPSVWSGSTKPTEGNKTGPKH